MKLIRPFTVTDANLTSNIAETDATEYAATATYGLADRVMNTTGSAPTHHIYESLVAGNIGNALTDATKWLDTGPTNKFAMFDQANGTATTGASGITASVAVTGRADGLALIGLDATAVSVTMSAQSTPHTNLATYSEQFDNAIWVTNAASIVANAATGPTGTSTADLLLPTGTGTSCYVAYNNTFGAGTFVFSVYVEAAGNPRVGMRVYDGASYVIKATFDLSTGTIIDNAAGTASITDVGGGHFRISCVGTTAAGNMGSAVGWVIESLPAGYSVQDSFNADGISGTYLWGAQIEQASAISAYIPTTSAAITTSLSTVYEQTYDLQSDSAVTSWYDYFSEEVVYKTDLILTDLPLYTDPTITVAISSTAGAVSCGTMVIGQTRDLGAALYGAQAGIQDYSKKDVDEFGNYTIVPRAFAKRDTYKLYCNNAQIDGLHALLASYRTTPAVWVGVDDYAATWVFGFYRDFTIEIAQPQKSYLSLEIEGLT